jgi:hypothetical protein
MATTEESIVAPKTKTSGLLAFLLAALVPLTLTVAVAVFVLLLEGPVLLGAVVVVADVLVIAPAFPIELTDVHELLLGAAWGAGVAGSPWWNVEDP